MAEASAGDGGGPRPRRKATCAIHAGRADPLLPREAEGAEGGPSRRQPLDRDGGDLPGRPFRPAPRRDARGRLLAWESGGEISIVFDRRLADRLKVILMIDNGGWSMDPYIGIVQTLFNYARSQFKDLKIYYFHNTLYSRVWRDPQRHLQPEVIEEFVRRDTETRLIIVGDAAMAPYELMGENGSLYLGQNDSKRSEERLKLLARTFRHAVWLNPQPESSWGYTWTIGAIGKIFPMFELTLDGLDKAVQNLKARD